MGNELETNIMSAKLDSIITNLQQIALELSLQNERYKQANKCPTCNGSGNVPYGGFSTIRCQKCDGTGIK